jgi:2-isopropylmalate synthase
LVEILSAVVEAGATTLNIPDTVGYVLPYEYGKIIAELKAKVVGVEKTILSTHCHDDLGVAVANSLAGVRSGARQIECAINGMGERAGNAALEEVVMAIHTRPDFFEGDVKDLLQINTQEITRTSQLVSRLTGFVIPPNKAIVGANAFAHESGIHVDGILKNRSTYEIMTAETVGLVGSRMVLGRHAGRHGFVDRCKQLGYALSPEDTEVAYKRFLEIADKKKEVFDEDITALINNEIHVVESTYELVYLHVVSGSGALPTASVKVQTPDGMAQAAATGDGPVDAAYEAIRGAIQLSPTVEHYSIRSVTGGKEAMGEAIVKVRDGDKIYAGRGASTDIIEASARAYVNAINRMVAVKTKC